MSNMSQNWFSVDVDIEYIDDRTKDIYQSSLIFNYISEEEWKECNKLFSNIKQTLDRVYEIMMDKYVELDTNMRGGARELFPSDSYFMNCNKDEIRMRIDKHKYERWRIYKEVEKEMIRKYRAGEFGNEYEYE